MKMKVAVFGAGRMGTFAYGQLPADVDKVIIDSVMAPAQALADQFGGTPSTDVAAAAEADVVALVLPAPVIDSVAKELAPMLKPGAIVLNMATKGQFDQEMVAAYPLVHFLDAKIVGHATSMKGGAPSLVVVKTENETIFQTIKAILPGYKKVVMGNSDLVGKISSIGSTEGIRAAIACRSLMKEYNIPKEWEDVVIYTVCAGTMQAYVEDDLGEFGRSLADKLETEMGLK